MHRLIFAALPAATSFLQSRFDIPEPQHGGNGHNGGGGGGGGRRVISYGPCQFPTLGIIVQRAWEVQNHVREPFWWVCYAVRVGAGARGCGVVWMARGRCRTTCGSRSGKPSVKDTLVDPKGPG